MKIGSVTVLEELGKGAGSRVYRVRREEDGLEYALKVVRWDDRRGQRYLDQVQNEFRIGQLLDHPNLIHVHVLETDAGWFTGPRNAWLLTEYAPGRTMERLPLLPVPRLLRIFERVASAVAYLHAHGIIHADLKPSNLILDDEAGVKVIDFGIAQLRGEHNAQPHATRDYMAPETAAHKRIDEHSDIYSFGATLYRLATLHTPPCALTAVVKGGHAFEHELRPARDVNPRVPEGLSELIGNCLQLDPARRPRSMGEIAARLAEMSRVSER